MRVYVVYSFTVGTFLRGLLDRFYRHMFMAYSFNIFTAIKFFISFTFIFEASSANKPNIFKLCFLI
jgi:hypothetical protein